MAQGQKKTIVTKRITSRRSRASSCRPRQRIQAGAQRPQGFGLHFEVDNWKVEPQHMPAQYLLAGLNEQDFLCRVFGDCVTGPLLDREVDTMIPSRGMFGGRPQTPEK
jgi:hypothetical protein